MTHTQVMELLKLTGACVKAKRWARRNRMSGSKLWARCPNYRWLSFICCSLGMNQSVCRAFRRADMQWRRVDKVGYLRVFRESLPPYAKIRAVALEYIRKQHRRQAQRG